MPKRDEYNIKRDMLIIAAPAGETDEVSLNGSSKTYIMKTAGLSYNQLGKHLNDLERSHLIKKEKIMHGGRIRYITTEKGLEFLEHHHEIEELIK